LTQGSGRNNLAAVQTDQRIRADARLEAALTARELADPRDGYRSRLRALREIDPDRFARALRHYEEVVLPGLAGEGDAVEVWIEYGQFLADMLAPGRTVMVNGAGRAEIYAVPLPRESMVLHLPEDSAAAAIPLVTPRLPTPPQRATYDLLVLGKLSL
jgi:hypothetical protein